MIKRPIRQRHLRNQILEARHCFAAVEFLPHGIYGDQPFNAVASADLDGDGDLDMVATSGRYDVTDIHWYENLDGRGRFSDGRLIDSLPSNGISSISFGDLNQDGRLDVIVSVPNEAAGFLQTADHHFQYLRLAMAEQITSVAVADLDADEDLDVIVGAYNSLGWATNNHGSFTDLELIEKPTDERNSKGQRSIVAEDIDGDGDQDIVCSKYGLHDGGWLRWYENRDGHGTFTEGLSISDVGRRSVQSMDFDADGDTDLVALNSRALDWFENVDGRGNFTQHEIPISGESYWSLLISVDLDHDNDYDLVAFEFSQGLVSLENNEAQRTFGEPHPIEPFNNGSYTHLSSGDVNGDGRMDFVCLDTLGNGIVWFQQRMPGDVNNDGIFTSADLVAVFMAGEYEDLLFNNSQFNDGDWNGDGEFNASDLVAVFQLGLYQE